MSLSPVLLRLTWLLKNLKGTQHQFLSNSSRTDYSRRQQISFKIQKIISCVWNKKQLSEQWKESIIVPVHKRNKTDCSNRRGRSPLSTTYKILSNIRLSRQINTQRKLLGIISVGFTNDFTAKQN